MVSLKQSMIWRENTGDMRGIRGCTYLIKLGKRRRILRSWSLSSVNRPDSLAKTGLTIAAVQRHCLVFAVCTALGLHVGEAS
jgi:hypothetical protein